ncbi:MAG: S41 family peptidase [Lachnospiraceae bacterium]|nr:S41 family peptidase [Lachnospiraceae bacterium]
MYQDNKNNIYKIIMMLLITIFVTVLVTIICYNRYLEADENRLKYITLSKSTSSIESLTAKAREMLNRYYLGEINDEELIEGALKGYVDALGDEYTEYYTPDEWSQIEDRLVGSYVGIGVYILNYTYTNQIVVISPIDGSPAYNAGIKTGDIITKVDGVEYTGEQIDIATSKLKGLPDTKVNVEIIRGEEVLTFEIERKEIIVNEVKSKMLENNIGYISIASFDKETANQFKEQAGKLLAEGAKGLIIDIRNNGGGLVETTCQIASYILPSNSIIMVQKNKQNEEKAIMSSGQNFINTKVVLLVNENSASSSEILAGALKENNAATLVGTKTFGKGIMQNIYGFEDENGKVVSAIKITTEEFFTPNKNTINEIGIEPNEIVELTQDAKGNTVDTQLNRAIEILK